MPPVELLDLLRRWEGLHRVGRDGLVYPYLCPAGYPTQGYGVLVKGLDVPPITVGQAEEELVKSASSHLMLAIKLSPGLAVESAGRQAAIASFVYNLGPGRYKASTLRKRVDALDWDGASKELLKWVWAGGRKLPGLVLRRSEESCLLLGLAGMRTYEKIKGAPK